MKKYLLGVGCVQKFFKFFYKKIHCKLSITKKIGINRKLNFDEKSKFYDDILGDSPKKFLIDKIDDEIDELRFRRRKFFS